MNYAKVIVTEADYKEALAEIGRLWGAAAGSVEAERLEMLAMHVHNYERSLEPLPHIDPIDEYNFRLEQEGFDPFPSSERLIEKWEAEIEGWKQEAKNAPALAENIKPIISDLEALVGMLKDK